MANEPMNVGGAARGCVSSENTPIITNTPRICWPGEQPSNLDTAVTFLAALGETHTFQTFDDNKDRKQKSLAKVINAPFNEKTIGILLNANMEGAGIFVTVNQTDGKGRRRENMVRTRAIYADFDGDSAIALFEAAAAKLPPSIVVASSPTKRHAYWLTDLSIDEAEQMQAKMPEAVGCDAGAKDVTRVLRIPGFNHCKAGPVQTTMLECHPERTYDAFEIITAFELDSIEGKTKGKPKADLAPTARASSSLGAEDYDLLDYVIKEKDAVLLADALKVLDASDRNTWITIGNALCRCGQVGDRLFCDWSATAGEAGGYVDDDDCIDKLRELEGRSKSNYPAIFTAAKDKGWVMGNAATNNFPSAESTKNTATEIFEDLTLSNYDVEAMCNAEFLIPGMIVRGHITVYPSPTGGGKTTLFVHFCEELRSHGLEVIYINVDSPPDMLRDQFAHATKHGYKLIAPDSKSGKSIRDVIPKLRELIKVPSNALRNTVIIIDTLKKFLNVLDKGNASDFFKLLRAINARGATICLLGHTNKYLSPEGELIFEGVGDIKSDIDDMIYLYSTLDPETNIREVTTKPDKVRAAFHPRSFRIHLNENRRVEECEELLQIMTDESRKVLKTLVEIIGPAGAMSQKELITALVELTPHGRERLRAILHQLAEYNYSPLKAKRVKENNSLQFSLRKPSGRIGTFEEG